LSSEAVICTVSKVPESPPERALKPSGTLFKSYRDTDSQMLIDQTDEITETNNINKVKETY